MISEDHVNALVAQSGYACPSASLLVITATRFYRGTCVYVSGGTLKLADATADDGPIMRFALIALSDIEFIGTDYDAKAVDDEARRAFMANEKPQRENLTAYEAALRGGGK